MILGVHLCNGHFWDFGVFSHILLGCSFVKLDFNHVELRFVLMVCADVD